MNEIGGMNEQMPAYAAVLSVLLPFAPHPLSLQLTTLLNLPSDGPDSAYTGF